jgi:hypothetical protein
MHLDEDAVQNAVVCFLPTIGYHAKKLKTLRQHGVDIKACHAQYSRYFEIEVKGEPGKGVKSAASGRETRFLLALGQALTRMRPERRYRYGIAFPDSYRDLVKRRVASSVMKRLDLSFFFVGDSGQVEFVQWKDWAESKKKAA